MKKIITIIQVIIIALIGQTFLVLGVGLAKLADICANVCDRLRKKLIMLSSSL